MNTLGMHHMRGRDRKPSLLIPSQSPITTNTAAPFCIGLAAITKRPKIQCLKQDRGLHPSDVKAHVINYKASPFLVGSFRYHFQAHFTAKLVTWSHLGTWDADKHSLYPYQNFLLL